MPLVLLDFARNSHAGQPEMIEAVARILYETDEDIVDEAIAELTATGEVAWQEGRNPRLVWDDLDGTLQLAYRRRARAAIAVMSGPKSAS